jgi:hypothetical protein
MCQIKINDNCGFYLEECSTPLRRFAIDFAHDSLADKLEELSDGDYSVFVIEGVFMYLGSEAIESTINAIQKLYPKHMLYCDLMTNKFFTRFAQSVHSKLVASGGEFTPRPDNPVAVFTRHNYDLMERIPMFKRARELGVLWDEAKIPSIVSWLLLNVFLKDLAGYAVHRLYFERN